jgi:hypothetical protein
MKHNTNSVIYRLSIFTNFAILGNFWQFLISGTCISKCFYLLNKVSGFDHLVLLLGIYWILRDRPYNIYGIRMNLDHVTTATHASSFWRDVEDILNCTNFIGSMMANTSVWKLPQYRVQYMGIAFVTISSRSCKLCMMRQILTPKNMFYSILFRILSIKLENFYGKKF